MKNQKGSFIPIIGVLVLIILVGGVSYYFGTQSVEDNPANIAPKTENKIMPVTETASPSALPARRDRQSMVVTGFDIFDSKLCGFTFHYPTDWKVEDTKGTDQEGYNFTCTYISAPDFKITGMDTINGLDIAIHRTKLGTDFKGVTINSLEDYIIATETIQEPKVLAKNVSDKTYGENSGKYFEYDSLRNKSHFIFSHKEYIYTISWPTAYSGPHKKDITTILEHFYFVD